MAPIVVRATVKHGDRRYRGRLAIDQLWGANEKLLCNIKIEVAKAREAVGAQRRLVQLGPYPDSPPHDLVINLKLGDLTIRDARTKRRAVKIAAVILLPLTTETSWSDMIVQVNGRAVDRHELAQELHDL